MDNQAPQANPKKLFLGNLPFNATEAELQELCAQYGEVVDIKLIIDRASGRSKGIAFVEYATEEEAQAAIEALNGFDLNGREMVVNVARPRVPRENRSFGGGGRSFDRRGGGDRGGYNRDNSRRSY